MVIKFFTGLLLFCLSQSLVAQRVLKTNTNRTPLSDKMSKSISGSDSLEVHLVNYDGPGLEIVSCSECLVTSNWLKGPGELDVIIRNNGATRSKAATAWVDYYYYFGLNQKHQWQRKGVPALDPGQTTRIKFVITFGSVELFARSEPSKIVNVILTQHPERGAW